MVPRHTPKLVLRQAPNCLLRRYFDSKGLLGHIPWDSLKETRIEPIHQAILELPEATRREIGRDFRAASDLASPRGSVLRKRQTNHTIDSGQLSIAGNPG